MPIQHPIEEWMQQEGQGFKQPQAARRLRLSQPMLSRIISYDRIPSVEAAERISRLTGIPCDELYGSKVRRRRRRRSKERTA